MSRHMGSSDDLAGIVLFQVTIVPSRVLLTIAIVGELHNRRQMGHCLFCVKHQRCIH
jgi:hypothetical protein